MIKAFKKCGYLSVVQRFEFKRYLSGEIDKAWALIRWKGLVVMMSQIIYLGWLQIGDAISRKRECTRKYWFGWGQVQRQNNGFSFGRVVLKEPAVYKLHQVAFGSERRANGTTSKSLQAIHTHLKNFQQENRSIKPLSRVWTPVWGIGYLTRAR